jgi:hypothetical protein
MKAHTSVIYVVAGIGAAVVLRYVSLSSVQFHDFV